MSLKYILIIEGSLIWIVQETSPIDTNYKRLYYVKVYRPPVTSLLLSQNILLKHPNVFSSATVNNTISHSHGMYTLLHPSYMVSRVETQCGSTRDSWTVPHISSRDCKDLYPTIKFCGTCLRYSGDSQSESEGDLRDAVWTVKRSDAAAANQHKEECAQEFSGQHPPYVAVVRDVVEPDHSLCTCIPTRKF